MACRGWQRPYCFALISSDLIYQLMAAVAPESYELYATVGMGLVFLFGVLFFRTHWARVHLHRIFLHPIDRHSQVLARAELEFHRARFDKTAEHSSILIMVSLLERDVVVFADEGVVKRVSQEAWNTVVQLLIAGIKEDRVADGWIQAIKMAGEILAKNFPAASHGANEIANEIIFKE